MYFHANLRLFHDYHFRYLNYSLDSKTNSLNIIVSSVPKLQYTITYTMALKTRILMLFSQLIATITIVSAVSGMFSSLKVKEFKFVKCFPTSNHKFHFLNHTENTYEPHLVFRDVSLVEFLDRLFYRVLTPQNVEITAEMLTIMFGPVSFPNGNDVLAKVISLLY